MSEANEQFNPVKITVPVRTSEKDWATLHEVVPAATDHIRDVSLDVVVVPGQTNIDGKPAGVFLRAAVRLSGDGRIIPLSIYFLKCVRDGGVYPVPSGKSAFFAIDSLPRAFHSLLIQCQHEGIEPLQVESAICVA